MPLHPSSVVGPFFSKRRDMVGLRIAAHLLLACFAGLAAFLLRYEFNIPPAASRCAVWGFVVWGITKPLLFYRFKTLASWRHFSVSDLANLLKANFYGSALSFAVLAAFCPDPFPRSIIVLDLAFSILLTAGARVMTRMLIEFSAHTQRIGPKRTLIYGAGEAGILLLQESRRNPKFGYEICGFIDDFKHPQQLVQGVRTLGRGEDLKRLVVEHKIERVLIASPSA